MSRPEDLVDGQLEELFALHRAGDGSATAAFAANAIRVLVAWLSHRNPTIDDHLIGQAIHQAVLDVLKKPTSFEPRRSPLIAYLRMAAQGDLRNLLRSEKRHRHIQLVDVELLPDAGKYLGRDEEPLLRLYVEEAEPPIEPDGLNEAEQQALVLIREGERSTSEFASVMGWSDRSVGEQRDLVKKLKDRLKKRVERAEAKRERPS